MIKYSLNNIELNYLGCHTQVDILDNELYLFNYVNKTSVVIKGDLEKNKQLLNMLTNGIDDTSLSEYLECNYGYTKDDYYYLLQKGLLE